LRFGPALVQRFFGRHTDRRHPLACQFEHRSDDRGIRALPLLQGAEDGREDVAHLAQEVAPRLCGLGGGELQHHPQMVGHFFGRQEQSRRGVSLLQVNHGRATVARVAVHMLKQVQ
jgi:hypothetical protein